MGRRRARPWSSATRRRRASLKSFRNIPKVDVLPVGSAGVVDVIGHASLIVTQSALDTLEARVGEVSARAASRQARRRELMDARQVILEPVVWRRATR